MDLCDMRVKLPNGEGFADLKYLSREPDRFGNDRLYFRRNGKRVRIESEPGTDAFWTEYKNAFSGASAARKSGPARTAPDSFRWLVEHYYAKSQRFAKLDDDTKLIRRRFLDNICLEPIEPGSDETIGSLPYAMVEAPAIKALRDRRADKTEAANARLKALRQVFKHGLDEGLLTRNPARDVAYIESDNPDGWHTWEVDEIVQYAKRHPVGTKAHLAMALLLLSGQRKSDIVRFGRQMVRDGVLHFTQQKNRKRKPVHMQIPVLPELQAVIDATPSANLTFLVTAYDKPFTRNGFGNWFRKRCDEAGLPQCSAHGLRKAGACIAAEAGATEAQLMAIFGWKTARMAALYIKKASQKALAANAMHLLVPEQIRLKLSHRSLGIADGATNAAKNG
jgi:integrase